MLSVATSISTLRKTVLLIAISSLFACSKGKAPDSGIEVAVKGINSAAVSDDGKYAVVGSIHHGGSLWRLKDGERLYNLNHKQGDNTTIVAADISGDSEWALTADPHTMILWDLTTGKPHHVYSAPGEVLDIALDQTGNFALLGLGDFRSVLFDVQNGGVKRSFAHQNRVRSVDLSDDGRWAVTGSEDYTAALWNVAVLRSQRVHQINHDDDVQMVAISPDGRLALSAAKYDKAVLWDTQSGKVMGEVPLASEKLNRGVRFTAARFSDDGRQLLTGRPDQVVQLWSTRTMKQLERWKLPKRDAWKPTSAAIVAVGFEQTNGRFIAVASNGFVHRLSR